jgi:hypothetical protein
VVGTKREGIGRSTVRTVQKSQSPPRLRPLRRPSRTQRLSTIPHDRRHPARDQRQCRAAARHDESCHRTSARPSGHAHHGHRGDHRVLPPAISKKRCAPPSRLLSVRQHQNGTAAAHALRAPDPRLDLGGLNDMSGTFGSPSDSLKSSPGAKQALREKGRQLPGRISGECRFEQIVCRGQEAERGVLPNPE